MNGDPKDPIAALFAIARAARMLPPEAASRGVRDRQVPLFSAIAGAPVYGRECLSSEVMDPAKQRVALSACS
jgi:hypothetical protein